jgi:alpha-galactosidase
MRYFLPIALFVSLASAHGATLEGTYAAEVRYPDGHTSRTGFIFHQNGAELSGKVVYSWGETPIVDGKVEGDKVSFFVEFGGARKVRIPWTGNVADGKVNLKIERPRRAPEELVAQPVDAKLVEPPAKLPLPAVKDLPGNTLARKPPMGWNSWNKFHREIDDKTVREIADAMVRTGMRDVGYKYVNIDDTWEGERDAQGKIHANKKFPDMKALADYVHSKNMLIGIYSSPGPETCTGYPGSYGHEADDAQTLEDWGIDYLKYDWCSAGRIYTDEEMRPVYQKMGEALASISRPIVFSLCQYGRNNVWEWGPKVGGNLWRTTGDIGNSWDSMSTIGFDQGRLAPYAGPGHWNDPDMLEVGNGGMTEDEDKTHFSLWAMLAAPLLAGNDIRNMSPKTLEILTNKEVIGVDQDPLGKQGTRLSKSGNIEIWTKPLEKGATAVAIFNRGAEPGPATIKWSDFVKKGKPVVRDLWRHEFVKASVSDTWTATVPKHGVVMLRISPLS